jgi:hypothetical protein
VIMDGQILRVVPCVWAIPTFQRNVHQLQGYESVGELITVKVKAVCSFETSGGSYLSTRHNDPEDMVSRYESRFVTNKVFGPCVISSG